MGHVGLLHFYRSLHGDMVRVIAAYEASARQDLDEVRECMDERALGAAALPPWLN